MYVARMQEIRGVMSDDAEGVTLLILLALGTFLAGVHAWSLPICLTGVVLALSVPLIAWVEQTAVLLILLLLGAAAAGGALWWIGGASAAPALRRDARRLRGGIDVAAVGLGRQRADPGRHGVRLDRRGMGKFHALAEAGVEGAIAKRCQARRGSPAPRRAGWW